MKLERWALIAEIVSGVAVVVTLLFLVVGIRENTNATNAAVYGSLIDGINELESRRLGDPGLILLWQAFRRGEADDLDEIDEGRLGLYLQILVRNYEKAYYNNTYGVIGASEWERFEDAICSVYRSSLGTIFAAAFDSGATSSQFQTFVVQTCSD